MKDHVEPCSTRRVTKKSAHEDTPILRAAHELHDVIEEMETLTRRVAKADLRTRNDLVRAGQLLSSAADAHRRFLAHLNALSDAVGELRDRQNASAVTLTAEAERVDARRTQHMALEERFAAIGAVAREIAASVMVIDEPTEADRAELEASLRDVELRIASAAQDARALAVDAREADLPELEKQAHAMSQELQSLHHKLRGVGRS